MLGGRRRGIHGCAASALPLTTRPAKAKRPGTTGGRWAVALLGTAFASRATRANRAGGASSVGQINISSSSPGQSTERGIATGMLVGIAIIILIVVVLIFLVGPRVLNGNTNYRSLLDALSLVT
jgi:hypothetical protein